MYHSVCNDGIRASQLGKKARLAKSMVALSIRTLFLHFFEWFVEKSVEVPILLCVTGHRDEPGLLLFKKM